MKRADRNVNWKQPTSSAPPIIKDDLLLDESYLKTLYSLPKADVTSGFAYLSELNDAERTALEDKHKLPGASKHVVHPYSNFRVRWDMMLVVVLCYNGFAIPLRVCFDIPEEIDFFFVLDRIIDFFFLGTHFPGFSVTLNTACSRCRLEFLHRHRLVQRNCLPKSQTDILELHQALVLDRSGMLLLRPHVIAAAKLTYCTYRTDISLSLRAHIHCNRWNRR